MRCFGYVRVSTKEQDEEIQVRAIEDFAKTRSIELVKVFVDKGESGGKSFRERPGASELLNAVELFRPECVVSWSLDRIGRSMLDTLNVILELENKGVKVITVKEEFLQTLDQNIRKLIISILAWVAEYERKRIRERQLEAWDHGKQKGRPPKLKPEELVTYIAKYPMLSLRDITRLINSERRPGDQVSYITVWKLAKKLGYVRVADVGKLKSSLRKTDKKE